MRTLTFNGVNSAAYGIFISGEGSFDAPARDRSSLTIPGRNGTLIIDNGRYKNITLKYPCFFVSSFQNNAASAREWLLAPSGYVKLTDDYHSDEYRLAIFTGGIEFEPTAWNLHAESELTFDCKPQRFLNSGDTPVTVANNGTISNPTGMIARPLISVTGTGNGTLSVGGTTVTLSDLNGGIVLDCDLQDAYYGLLPANDQMEGEFPTLKPGSNGVAYTGGITAVSITPRWWRI